MSGSAQAEPSDSDRPHSDAKSDEARPPNPALPTPGSIVAVFTYQPGDGREAYEYILSQIEPAARCEQRERRRRLLGATVLLPVLVAAGIYAGHVFSRPPENYARFGGVLGFCVWALVAAHYWNNVGRYSKVQTALQFKKLNARSTGGKLYAVRLEPDGVSVESDDARVVYKWAKIVSVVMLPSVIAFAWEAPEHGIIVPRRAFVDVKTTEEFVATARRFQAVGGHDEHARLVRLFAEHDISCPQCGYSLRNLSANTCPECGRSISVLTAISLSEVQAPKKRSR